MFTEPTATKVTNSIIAVWKREMASAAACCRYPGCTFASNDIDQLKEHHVQCEIGLKTKAFTCLKCSFRSASRAEIVEHVLATHVSETDAAFELSGPSGSDESEDEDEGVEEDEEAGPGDSRRKSSNGSKNVDKAYGLSSAVIQQLKCPASSRLIPSSLAK